MDQITPRDHSETSLVGTGRRIATALGIIISTAAALCGAIGGLDWISANLPLLGVGLGSLVSGGLAAWIAVRRMRVDRLASKSLALLLLAAPALLLAAGCLCRREWLRLCLAALLPLAMLTGSGCVAIRADSTAEGAGVWAFGWGADSTAQLANVALTGPGQTDAMQTGVSFDSANGQQQSYQAIQSLVSLGAALAPILSPSIVQPGLAPGDSPQPSTLSPQPIVPPGLVPGASTDTDPSSLSPQPSAFTGSPAADGSGVYGRRDCSRCEAYALAHPDAPLIDIDIPANRAAMWAALRARAWPGGTAQLPVLIDASSFQSPAR